MEHQITKIEALYPRLNQPYRFDPSAGEHGKTVPCDVFDEHAKYEMDFILTREQAETLYRAMAKEYQEKRRESWPAKMPMPFEQRDDGRFSGKTSIKAAYNKEATRRPGQYDAKNHLLPDDFLLSTGSICNLAVVFFPYCMFDGNKKVTSYGVSLRLRAVQVLEYKPLEAHSPFEATDGFTSEETEEPNPFDAGVAQVQQDASFEEENPFAEANAESGSPDEDIPF